MVGPTGAMRTRRGRLGVALLACLALPLADAPRGPARTTQILADLDADGVVERVVLDPLADPTVTVLRGDHVLWRGIPKELRPWKLAVADMEGDGRPEIVLGLRKGTPYRPFLHNCLFVYGWDREGMFPKWLGSALSHPFTDFAFADLDGEPGDELVAVETDLDGSQCVVIYSWTGFGFAGDPIPGRWRTVRLVSADAQAVRLEADGRPLLLEGGAL